MKKAIVAVTLITGLAVAVPVFAHWGHGYGGNGGNGYRMQNFQQDPASREKLSKFYQDNQDLTRQITMKRAEKAALLRADTPDSKEVAKVTGELFDLRTTLMTKADEAGVTSFMGPGRGFGMGRHMMGGPGMGRHGRGYGMTGGNGGRYQNCPMW